ncbi:MAG: hypothetical protein Q9161_001298 [Pseudevernia consocians]
MSQWNHLPSGPKRRSDFTDPERLGSYRFPLPQQSLTSQSSEASTSPPSSQEGQKPKAVGQLPSITARTGISSDVVETRIDPSFHGSSSKMRLPTPSPTSSAPFTLPPLALSSPRPASYTPRSGNLPHKLGTDHFTIQTLQRENTDLASAYAQAQIYIADLDTKNQASRVENGRLVKDRQIMTGKIELLEAQLEELEQSIQQSQEHTVAKDAQYSRIVELSTRLQSQSAAESRARKAEQHEWFSNKKSMQSVIDSLKNEITGLCKAYGSCAKFSNLTPSPVDDDPYVIEGNPSSAAESSSHELIAEMEALRRANARMKDALAGVRVDTAHLAEYIEKLGSVEENIQMHLQRAETARSMLDFLDGEGATAKEQGLTVNED